MIKLEDLCGKHILSGIEVGSMKVEGFWRGFKDANYIKFTLDDTTYLSIENPDDGYRSYMEDLAVVDEGCSIELPNIEVVCTMREDGRYGKNDILVFVDTGNGKEILAVGTGNTGDYYPYCVLEYNPENMSCNEERR